MYTHAQHYTMRYGTAKLDPAVRTEHYMHNSTESGFFGAAV